MNGYGVEGMWIIWWILKVSRLYQPMWMLIELQEFGQRFR
jgi:hypothetical protein